MLLQLFTTEFVWTKFLKRWKEPRKDSKQTSPEKRERPFMETNHDAASQVKTRATSPAQEAVSNPIAVILNLG